MTAKEVPAPLPPKHWMEQDESPKPDDTTAYLRPNLWKWNRTLNRIDLHVGVDQRTAEPVLVNLADLREVCYALSTMITSAVGELDGWLPPRVSPSVAPPVPQALGVEATMAKLARYSIMPEGLRIGLAPVTFSSGGRMTWPKRRQGRERQRFARYPKQPDRLSLVLGPVVVTPIHAREGNARAW